MSMVKKMWFKVSLVALTVVLGITGVLGVMLNHNGGLEMTANSNEETIDLGEESEEYQTVFENFGEEKLLLNEEENTIKYTAKQTVEVDLLRGVSSLSYGEKKEEVEIEYIFDYDAEANKFILTAKLNKEGGAIIDEWEGTPFITETNQIDIAFATDDGLIMLSDLKGKEDAKVTTYGWFSDLFKTVAQVAAAVVVVAAVVAVVVVAAPAVAAAGTAIGTAVAAGGGAAVAGATATAAVTAAATAATVAMGSTAFAIATTTMMLAGTAAITSYLASKTFENLEEKVKAAVAELTKLKEFTGKVIYRAAGAEENLNRALTPKEKDLVSSTGVSGLSLFDSMSVLLEVLKGTKHVAITTDKLINDTGTLKVINDKPFHYSVRPIAGDVALAEWASTYENANSNPHMYTTTLREIVFYV